LGRTCLVYIVSLKTPFALHYKVLDTLRVTYRYVSSSMSEAWGFCWINLIHKSKSYNGHT